MSELIHVALDDGVMQGDSPPKLNTSSMRKRKRGTISAIIDGWASIENRIKDLNNTLGGPSKGLPINYDQFTLHYTTIYNMCTWKWPHDDSQQLHEIRKTAFENYILLLNDIQILPDSRERHEEDFLIELVYRWNIYKLMVRCLSNHVDGCENSLSTLYDVGIQCFRNLVYSRIHAEARELILDLINNEREGRQINRPLLKNVIGFYVEIGMGDMLRYETDFEPFLLAETSTYYREKALRWTGQDTCPEYMLKSENCIKEERERVSHYLHPSSEEKLVEKVQHVLLFKYGYKLLEREHSGCHSLLKEGKVDDLSRMYRLYSRVPMGLEPIGRFFKQYILDEGTALAQQAEDAALKKAENAVGGSHEHIYVSKVIQLHDKCMVYVIDCFGSHTIFHKALWEAFVFFLNKDVVGCSGAELLASFCDNILKKGGSGKLSDEAIEDSLEQVAKLLSYVNSKDMFAELYRKKLSRRLLLDKIANDDHERSALIKFKQQCGVHFSLKMEGMVTDLILGRENQRHFEEYLVQNPKAKPGLDMSVTVLTPGFWPSYKCSDIKLPSEMVRCVESFMQFYQTKTKNRKLNWVYSLGSCNINCKFGQKTIELVVGTYQAAVLLLFNNVDCLSYSEIATHIKLADDDLVRVLQSLSCAKYRILTKEPNTKTVSHTDHFSFNSDFTDKKRRIRIPLPPMDEWKKNVEDVNKARQRSADIVRIMRNRKVLGYQQLINECIVQIIRCMSKPDIKAIKERIEDFIARGYIERDKDNPRMLKYVSD